MIRFSLFAIASILLLGLTLQVNADDEPKNNPSRNALVEMPLDVPLKDSVWLEVEIARGNALDRIKIYICNGTKKEFSFLTGARGGTGSLNDQVKNTIGTAPTVIPKLIFQGEKNNSIVRPPAFGGPTRRSMRPAKLEIPSGKKVLYASFSVPHSHVADKFLRAELQLRDGREITGSKLLEKKNVQEKR